MTPHTGAPILLVEDDRATGALIVQLLAAARITNPVVRFESGGEALAYLQRAAAGEEAAPVICVLDLSLPDVTGLDVLRHIRGSDRLAKTPAIMLTGSGHDEDIEAAYAIGIAAYLIKPAGVHGLPDVILELDLGYQLLPVDGEASA